MMTSKNSQNRPNAKSRPNTQQVGAKETPDDAQRATAISEADPANKIYNRYYHMFGKGELLKLVCEAARDMGLAVKCTSGNDPHANPQDSTSKRGIEIVQDGWEKSNYYVEFRCWEAV